MADSPFSSERSRPIIVDMAISAPARSMDEQATSISRRRITSRIEVWWTSTSYIDFSTVSGSMPWDMVRLPWGSMSTQSTRWPFSAKATATLSVVVVFATPPFWLAKAMTLACGTGCSADSVTGWRRWSGRNPLSPVIRNHIRYSFRHDGGPRQAPGLRDRQGWRGEVDRRRRAGHGGGAPGAPDHGGRGLPSGPHRPGLPRRRLALPRGRAGRRAVDDLRRPAARAGRVPANPGARERAGRPAVRVADVPVLRRGHTGHERAGDHGEDLGAGAAAAAHAGRVALRPGDRRRARHRSRPGHH